MFPQLLESTHQRTFSMDRVVLDVVFPYVLPLTTEIGAKLHHFRGCNTSRNKVRLVTKRAVCPETQKVKSKASDIRGTSSHIIFKPTSTTGKPEVFHIHQAEVTYLPKQVFAAWDDTSPIGNKGEKEAIEAKTFEGMYTTYTAHKVGLSDKGTGVIIRARRILNINRMGKNFLTATGAYSHDLDKSTNRVDTNYMDPRLLDQPWSKVHLQHTFLEASQNLHYDFTQVLYELGINYAIHCETLKPSRKNIKYPVVTPSDEEIDVARFSKRGAPALIIPLRESLMRIREIEFGFDLSAVDPHEAYHRILPALKTQAHTFEIDKHLDEVNKNSIGARFYLRKGDAPDSMKWYTKTSLLLRLEIQSKLEHFQAMVTPRIPDKFVSPSGIPYFPWFENYDEILDEMKALNSRESRFSNVNDYYIEDGVPYNGWQLVEEIFNAYVGYLKKPIDALDAPITQDLSDEGLRKMMERCHEIFGVISGKKSLHPDFNEIFKAILETGRVTSWPEARHAFTALSKAKIIVHETGKKRTPWVIAPKYRATFDYLIKEKLLPLP